MKFLNDAGDGTQGSVHARQAALFPNFLITFLKLKSEAIFHLNHQKKKSQAYK